MRMYTNCQGSRWEVGNPSPAPTSSQKDEGSRAGAAAGSFPSAGTLPACLGGALEMIGDGLVVTNLSHAQHPIVYTNAAFERLTGYAAGELLGRSYGVLQGAHGDPATFAAIDAALRDERTWSGEVRISRKDGTAAWQELRVMPMPDDTGQVRYALGVQVDITERKDLQERLRQAEHMASIGWLAGGLAHDFNNLLTPILGYCDLLLAAAPPIPVRDGLEEIRKAGEWGVALIGQLQALCRRQKPQAQLVELPAVLANVENLLHCLLPRNVELVTCVDPAVSPIQAVPGQVEQILLNLIRNACDAMPQGGTITMSAGNTDREAGTDMATGGIVAGPSVLLAVTDTGCGMNEEVRARLFEPLFSTKDGGRGSGLGLFMVHGIVKENHGDITVTSQPGRGTCVAIHWPVAAGAAARVAPVQRPGRQGTETILLADDEPGIREVVCWVLRQQGYTVLEAGNGLEAVTIGQEYPGVIHLLLTDVAMPQMDAHELVARLAPRRPEMKVVYFSGDRPDEAGDFLPKPFTPEILIRKVREVLGGGASRSPSDSR